MGKDHKAEDGRRDGVQLKSNGGIKAQATFRNETRGRRRSKTMREREGGQRFCKVQKKEEEEEKKKEEKTS